MVQTSTSGRLAATVPIEILNERILLWSRPYHVSHYTPKYRASG